MDVISLEQGIYLVDKEKNLTPLSSHSPDLSPKLLRMAVRPFVITLKNDIILLDCGIGDSDRPAKLVTSLLKEHGINPDQITKVLLSHLHKDHIGGLGFYDQGNFIQNFPNASIYVNLKELDYALSQPRNLSYNHELVQQLSKLPNLQLLTEAQGQISSQIYFEVAGGHSPNHLAFWIFEPGETIFYGGDNLPQAHYLDYPIAYKSDYDGKKAMELRKTWQIQAKGNHWTILLYHDLKLETLKF